MSPKQSWQHALHNFLQLSSTPLHIPVLPPDAQAIPLQPTRRVGRSAAAEGVAVRDNFMTYFNQDTTLPWQCDHVRRGLIERV